MAPAVARRDRGGHDAAAMIARMRAHVRDSFDYVGDGFAKEARAIHDGDSPERPIWGQATPDEARALVEDGVPVAPLPDVLAPTPPTKVN
jgi:hypothetical protein